ncbi:SCP-like extracellular protein [Alkaliphilus metalliredigens QYMF]|uniref:SCP-like extracellular protein n=1 Tax=Alkaliphilus metalliredigens (strain QYMF) TaxID=293826 RepID=A6TJK6_ALKMQ|nr:CAP domain-containing protein [Alkaliphilus metalliredigens]ABR46374.1 SCP-like extracellular protein [Alkaliphilus metalliredigens QYMF]
MKFFLFLLCIVILSFGFLQFFDLPIEFSLDFIVEPQATPSEEPSFPHAPGPEEIELAAPGEDFAFSYRGISLGTSLDKVHSILGAPHSILPSEYPFQWYIFHEDYQQYVQVGIANGHVVALYSNDAQWQNPWAFDFNTLSTTVESVLGNSLDRIQKDNIIYLLPEDRHYLLFEVERFYLTVFFDIHNNNQVTSFLLIDQEIENKYHAPLDPDIALAEAYKEQVFYLTNAIRVRHDLPLLTWHEGAAVTALGHSKDMAVQNFFDHRNPQGEDPFDRMAAQGIMYRRAGENIAAGQQNSIFAHEGWMNSLGHRQAILGDFNSLGVGVHLGGPLDAYYTQNFLSQ